MKKAELIKVNNKFQVVLSFDFDVDTLNKVKTLDDRRYNPDNRTWYFPIYLEGVEKIKEWNFVLCSRLQRYLEMRKLSNIPTIDEIPGLKGILFPFQKKGVEFIDAKKGRAIVADEMGLGKTIQALAWLQLHKELKPIIIVCPASLKYNWLNEIRNWTELDKILIVKGRNTYDIDYYNILIINYGIVDAWLGLLTPLLPKVLILDEFHYIKNSTTKRTKAIKLLKKNIPHIIALSGTPIINRPVEFYTGINIIDSTLFPSGWKYKHKYCGAKHNGFGWQFNGASNTEELHNILSSTIMIRRLKKDVLTDLPDKLYSFVPMEINNRETYNEAKDDFVNYMKKVIDKEYRQKEDDIREFSSKLINNTNLINDEVIQWEKDEKLERISNAEFLVKIELLKQLAVEGKMYNVIDWIDNFLESGEKLVIFATHRKIIEHIYNIYNREAVKIDGSTPQNERQLLVDRFQNDNKIKIFIGNIRAAGVGLTLTASSNVAFVEYPWTPGELQQAMDRCHRIGQKNSVNIHYLMAVNTIEEEIALLLDSKAKVLSSILDGKDSDSKSLISILIDKYKNQKNS